MTPPDPAEASPLRSNFIESASNTPFPGGAELLQQFLTHSPDRVAFKDRQSRFLAASEARARRHQLTPAQLLGKTDFDLSPEAVALASFQDEQAVMMTGRPTAEIRRQAAGAGAANLLVKPFALGQLAEEIELPASLLRLLGDVPSYYLRYYYAHDEVLREQLDSPTRAEAVQRVERELLELYGDPAVDTKPEQLAQRATLGLEYTIVYFPLVATDRSGLELFEREVLPALA